jgi:hypothetical protein
LDIKLTTQSLGLQIIGKAEISIKEISNKFSKFSPGKITVVLFVLLIFIASTFI